MISSGNRSFRFGAGRGFTLIEMMTVIAVTSVLVLILTQVFLSVTRTAQSTEAALRTQETLNSLARQIRFDLRSMALTPLGGDTSPLRLVVLDGDNAFTHTLHSHHSEWSESPGERSDRIHFHGFVPNQDLGRKGSKLASERGYYAYWINGPESPKSKAELENQWGILRRKVFHLKDHSRDGHRVPCIQKNECVETPLLDLNTRDEDHRFTQVMGIHVDYLSIRLFDGKSGQWIQTRSDWDQAPDDIAPDDGASVLWDSRELDRFPTVVEIAVRAYDPRVDAVGSNESGSRIHPRWHRTTVRIQ